MVIIYGGVLFFSLLFTGVYYLNSHGLRDPNMTYLFIPSSIALILFFSLFLLKRSLGSIATSTFNIGFGWLWCYLCLSGIYAMAKVVSGWLWLFLVLAVASFTISLIFAILHFAGERAHKSQGPRI